MMFFVGVCVLFFSVGTVYAARSSYAKDVLTEMNSAIRGARVSAISSTVSVEDVVKTENDDQCGIWQYDLEIFFGESIGYRDFLGSFLDIFRSSCLRDDIWDLQDKMKDVTRAMDRVLLNCDKNAGSVIKKLQKSYMDADLVVAKLRSKGENMDVYKSYDKDTNPRGCEDDILTDLFGSLEKRIDRIEEKAKNLGKGFDVSAKEEKAMRARVKAAAARWFQNINLGVFRMDHVAFTKRHQLLGISGVMKSLQKLYEKTEGQVTGAWGKPGTVDQIIAEKDGNITQSELKAAIEMADRRELRDMQMKLLKATYLTMYQDSSVQVAQYLENQLILADTCVRTSYIEREALAVGCRGGSVGPTRSLPYFGKKLQDLLDNQCSIRRCVIPAKWINAVKFGP